MERRKRLPIASNFPKFQKHIKVEKPKVLVLGVVPEKHPKSEVRHAPSALLSSTEQPSDDPRLERRSHREKFVD